MVKFIEATGKNEEEAIAKGLAQLGLDRDDVSVEILERGKTGFLGIGSVPAKVKLSYEAAEEEQVEQQVEEPVSAPVEEEAAPCASVMAEETAEDSTPEEEIVEDDVAQAIVRFQSGLFAQMGVEATSRITRSEETYRVVLEGENMGALIGHRGETLDAIQQLTGYVVNRGRSHRVRIHVDAEGYRARREQALQRLAHKTATKVVKYRRNITLEAMNAYERHVIHAALQDVPGVSTYSTGTEPNRRTVVAYAPEKR